MPMHFFKLLLVIALLAPLLAPSPAQACSQNLVHLSYQDAAGAVRAFEGDPGEVSQRGKPRPVLRWGQLSLRQFTHAVFYLGLFSAVVSEQYSLTVAQREYAWYQNALTTFEGPTTHLSPRKIHERQVQALSRLEFYECSESAIGAQIFLAGLDVGSEDFPEIRARLAKLNLPPSVLDINVDLEVRGDAFRAHLGMDRQPWEPGIQFRERRHRVWEVMAALIEARAQVLSDPEISAVIRRMHRVDSTFSSYFIHNGMAHDRVYKGLASSVPLDLEKIVATAEAPEQQMRRLGIELHHRAHAAQAKEVFALYAARRVDTRRAKRALGWDDRPGSDLPFELSVIARFRMQEFFILEDLDRALGRGFMEFLQSHGPGAFNAVDGKTDVDAAVRAFADHALKATR